MIYFADQRRSFGGPSGHRSKPPHGFTLVELLVVIGIISVLVAMLLPALNKARQQANKVQCQSNMRQIGIGMTMYLSEHKGAYPQQTYVTSGWYPLEAHTWWGAIAPYIGWKPPYTSNPQAAAGTLGHCPDHFESPGSFSYVGNWQIINNFDDTGSPPAKVTRIRQTAQTIWLWEVHTESWWPNTLNPPFRGKSPFNPPRGTHGKMINYLFCDGHVADFADSASYPSATGVEFYPFGNP